MGEGKTAVVVMRWRGRISLVTCLAFRLISKLVFSIKIMVLNLRAGRIGPLENLLKAIYLLLQK